MARFVKHIACDKCGSSDGNAVYDNGSTYCFVCKHSTQESNSYRREDLTGKIDVSAISRLPSAALRARGISEATSAQYGVKVEYDQSTGDELAYYFPLQKPNGDTGWAKRTLPKDFTQINGKDALPFGYHVAGNGGKFLIVTEGCEDALAAVDLLAIVGKKYRVVASMGTERWTRSLDYFERFDRVVIAFDMDEAGERAAREFSEALSAGKALIARWNPDLGKDPNDLLRNGHHQAFLDAVYKAQPHQPDGIIYGEAIWEAIKDYTAPEFIHYPPEWTQLGEQMGGIRRGEISLWCGGTGCGKTSYLRRLKQHIVSSTDWSLGEIELEESKEKTIRGTLQFQAKKRMADMTQEEKRAAYEATYGTGRMFLLDHRARYTRGTSLMSKLKYLHYGMGTDIIMLDHITLAVSEFGDGNGLADQDRMMNEFLEFVETSQAHLCLISHLRKSPASTKSFECGAIPREDDLKGSGSLKQISFDIIGVSRNKHHEDEYERNVSQLHALKCRETGATGPCDRMYWDGDAQSLVPAAEPIGEGDYDEGEF